MGTWGDLKRSAMDVCLRGVYYVFCQRKNFNDFEGSISNVDLGLFYPNNQLMFSFVTFWFC